MKPLTRPTKIVKIIQIRFTSYLVILTDGTSRFGHSIFAIANWRAEEAERTGAASHDSWAVTIGRDQGRSLALPKY